MFASDDLSGENIVDVVASAFASEVASIAVSESLSILDAPFASSFVISCLLLFIGVVFEFGLSST